MALSVAVLVACATCITAWRLVDGVIASARCRLCPAATAYIGADCAGDRLEVGLDVSGRDVIPLAGSCSLSRTSGGTATLCLVGAVGEAGGAG